MKRISLPEVQRRADEICEYGSTTMLLIATELARRMNRDDLQRLTDRCLTEERVGSAHENATCDLCGAEVRLNDGKTWWECRACDFRVAVIPDKGDTIK